MIGWAERDRWKQRAHSGIKRDFPLEEWNHIIPRRDVIPFDYKTVLCHVKFMIHSRACL